MRVVTCMDTDLSSSRAQERARRWGRLGYLTYGVVQLALGYLALALAFGRAPQEASTSGAMSTLVTSGSGRSLVWFVALGMVLLAAWQAMVAVTEHDGLGARVAAGGKAIAYMVVAAVAIRVATGSGGSGGDSGEQAATTLFDLPGGVVLVAAVGVGFAAVGVFLIWRGLSTAFRDDLERGATQGRSGTVVLWLGRVGYVAKGVAFAVIGALFFSAAVTRDADAAGGLDQALQTLKQQPFGPVLLAAVGVGFAAFGLYSFARAGYERD